MKFSSKVQKCQLSPVRQFNPCAAEAEAKGRTIYHLNIGQPDIKTPDAFFEAVRNFKKPVLEYAPTPGLPEYLDAVRGYAKIGIKLDRSDILVTSGAGEALEFVLATILDDGDELLVPEPYYANYNTFAYMTGGSIRPIPTSPEEGYRYADKARIESPDQRAYPGHHGDQPRQPHRRGADSRGDADHRGHRQRARPVPGGGRGVPGVLLQWQGLTTFASFEDAKDHLIIVDSISKRFSACGARVGCLISRNPELIAQAMKLCQGRLCPATIDQLGAAAMYRSVEPSYFEKRPHGYKSGGTPWWRRGPRSPELRSACRTARSISWPPCRWMTRKKLQYFLLEEFEDHGETVMFAPGSGFYADPAKGPQRNPHCLCEELRLSAPCYPAGGQGRGRIQRQAGRVRCCGILSWEVPSGNGNETDLFLTGLQGLYGEIPN